MGASSDGPHGGADEHKLTATCGRVAALLVLVAIHSLPTAAVAQVATGSIVGTVVDTSGQLVPGAQVTVREVNRNTTTTLTTDAAGVYTAPFLVPGTYEVSVEFQGFKSWIRRAIVLQVNDRLRIDASLEVGTVTESTTVQAESPLVRTDSSEVGTVIEEVAIKELPLNGRNFATLVYLAPGITPGRPARTFQAPAPSTRAAPRTSTRWAVRPTPTPGWSTASTTTSSRSTPSSSRPRSSRCASSRCCRASSRPSSDAGRASSPCRRRRAPTSFTDRVRVPAQRRVRRAQLLRPQGRGGGRHAREGSGAAARPASVRRRARRRGGDPGPLRRPQPHVLLRRLRRHQGTRGVTTVNTVPTAATRTGDFSNYRDRNGNLIPIYDPLTTRVDPATGRVVRDQFPNNIIPQERINLRRPEHRQHLPAAEQRQQQLRQLHLDARPRDHRQRVLRPRRPPAVGQRLVLRPVQLRQVQARRAAGSGQLLPAHAAGGGRPLRSRAVRRRHPEHEADDPRRRVQLLEGAEPDPRQRAAHRLRQHRAVHDAVRLWPLRVAVARHPRHQHQRHHHRVCRTSASRTSPASPAVRRSCRSIPASSTTRSRTCWCG